MYEQDSVHEAFNSCIIHSCGEEHILPRSQEITGYAGALSKEYFLIGITMN